MIKRTKIISIVLCAVFAAAFSCTAVFANPDKLIDDAALFTQSESTDLKSMIDTAIEKTGWDMLIYTNENYIDEYDMEDYCNDYYDENDYGIDNEKSGISLTIDMGSRQMYIITKGDTMYYFSDSRLNRLLDDVQDELIDGDYYGAAECFINGTVDCFNSGEPYGDSYNSPEDDSYDNIKIVKKSPDIYQLLLYGGILLLVSAGTGFLVVFLIHRKYKNNGKENTYDLHSNSKLRLTNSKDTFLRKSISVHTVESSSSHHSSSSHSGGSSHSSSSHGGGGRSF